MKRDALSAILFDSVQNLKLQCSVIDTGCSRLVNVDHFFVSPHLDDIALSCAGTVHRLVSEGQSVSIVTVCTADRPPDIAAPLSAAAKHVHWEWQLGERPYAHRRAEDVSACASLGATCIHLGLLDAVYRHGVDGQPLYERDFIGIPANPADWQAHALQVSARLWHVLAPHQGDMRVYGPLAVGRHVDHTLVRQVLDVVVPRETLVYYEDYPYADRPDALAQETGPDLAAETVALTATEIDMRVQTIARYPSQLFALFQQADTMPARVRGYIERAGGERYWRRLR